MRRLKKLYTSCRIKKHQAETAKIVWIPKEENKESGPISLLPIIGKVLDKINNGERRSLQVIRFQGRYTTGNTTDNTINRIKSHRKEKVHTLVVALHIQNVFDVV